MGALLSCVASSLLDCQLFCCEASTVFIDSAFLCCLLPSQVSPGQRWCQQYFKVLQNQLTSLSAQQLAAATASLGQLGWCEWPEGWGAKLAARLAPELAAMTAGQLLQAAQVGNMLLARTGVESSVKFVSWGFCDVVDWVQKCYVISISTHLLMV